MGRSKVGGAMVRRRGYGKVGGAMVRKAGLW